MATRAVIIILNSLFFGMFVTGIMNIYPQRCHSAACITYIKCFPSCYCPVDFTQLQRSQLEQWPRIMLYLGASGDWIVRYPCEFPFSQTRGVLSIRTHDYLWSHMRLAGPLVLQIPSAGTPLCPPAGRYTLTGSALPLALAGAQWPCPVRGRLLAQLSLSNVSNSNSSKEMFSFCLLHVACFMISAFAALALPTHMTVLFSS